MSELYLFDDGVTPVGLTPSFFPVDFGGVTYTPGLISRSKIDRTDNPVKSSVTFTIAKTHSFALKFIQTLSERPVKVKIYSDAKTGKCLWTGWVFSPKASMFEITLECKAISIENSKTAKGQVFSLDCWKSIYTPKCGVLKEDFVYQRFGVNLTTNQISISGHPFSSTYFANGFIEFGAQTRRIVSQSGDTLFINERFSGDALTGAAIDIYPVCNLTQQSCIAFDNLEEFGGFNFIPSKNPFKNAGLL